MRGEKPERWWVEESRGEDEEGRKEGRGGGRGQSPADPWLLLLLNTFRQHKINCS